jgi:hypothetical protein
MVIKTYFELSWTGPEVQVDSKGNVTSTGEVKGKLSRRHCCAALLNPRAALHSSSAIALRQLPL